MKQTEPIKDFYGRILGYIETDTVTGDKVAKNFFRQIIGYYDKKTNTTKNFYKQIIGKGDLLSYLIRQEEEKSR